MYRKARVIKARVALDPLNYQVRLPQGSPGDVRSGYNFYWLKTIKIGIRLKTKLQYITCDIVDKPIWNLGTQHLYDSWKDRRLFARPVVFTWQDDGGWVVKPCFIKID